MGDSHGAEPSVWSGRPPRRWEAYVEIGDKARPMSAMVRSDVERVDDNAAQKSPERVSRGCRSRGPCDRTLLVAHRIVRSSDAEWIGIFEELRRERRLLTTVHQLNLLLDQTAHREVARSALKRMGLEYGG